MHMKHIPLLLCMSVALSSCGIFRGIYNWGNANMPVSKGVQQQRVANPQYGSYGQPQAQAAMPKKKRRGCDKCHRHKHGKVAHAEPGNTPAYPQQGDIAPASLYQQPTAGYPTAPTPAPSAPYAPAPSVATGPSTTFTPYDPNVPVTAPVQTASNQPINYYPEYSYVRQGQPQPGAPTAPTTAVPTTPKPIVPGKVPGAATGLAPVEFPTQVPALPTGRPVGLAPSVPASIAAFSPPPVAAAAPVLAPQAAPAMAAAGAAGQMLPNGTMLPAGLPPMPAEAMSGNVAGFPGAVTPQFNQPPVAANDYPGIGSALPGGDEVFSIHPSHDPFHPDFDPNNIPSTPPPVNKNSNYVVEETEEGAVGYDKSTHFPQGAPSSRMQELKRFLGYQ